MAKDVNIHVKVAGTEEAIQSFDSLLTAMKEVDREIIDSQKRTAQATETTTSKFSAMNSMLNYMRGQVLRFIGGWLGLHGVLRLIDYFIERLEKLKKIQEDIYQKSLSLGEISQGLAVQLGQPGKQREWIQQALKLQQAGGLASPEVAAQMLVSMDVAFAKQGGVKTPAGLAAAGQLAPFVGAMQLKPEQVQSLFGLAGQEGIAPTAEAYKQFFGEIYAASQMTKTRDFGQFVSQLSKGMETQEKERVEVEQRKGISPHKRKELLAAIQPTEEMKFRAAAKGAVPTEVAEDYLTTIIAQQRALDAAIAGEKLKRAPEVAEKERIKQVTTAEEELTESDIALGKLFFRERVPLRTLGEGMMESVTMRRPHIIINYDSHIEFNPIVGGKAERGIGPMIEGGVQP